MHNAMTLVIAKSDWDAIRRHGEETYPSECCGVLVGKMHGAEMKTVQRSIRCSNTRDDSPHNRYNINPEELFRIQRHCHETGLEIVGFYHSHPDHPARWSDTDLAEAHWSGCSYVITSVERGRASETNSFVLAGNDEHDKAFHDENIEIADANALEARD
jgi:proteasome lid subunit RPN8/RPN11